MIYNIAKHSLVKVDTDETTIDLPTSKLLAILDVSESPIATISGSDKFVLQCDLGSRVHLSDIAYHFSSSSVPAGTVNILYKNEPFQDYVSLSTLADEDGYRTTLSGILGGDPFAPRYVRLEHDLTSVSGTVSGTIYGFELLTDDTTVDFGADGTATVSEFEVARGGLSQIQAVPIYNSGESIVDAFVCLEPTYTDVDNIISISTSDTGPWSYSLDQENKIAGANSFQNGIYENLEVTDSRLTISNFKDDDGASANKEGEGLYTTKIFYLNPSQQNRVLLDVDRSKGGFITFSDDKLTETIEIRSSNAKPVDYSVFRELYERNSGSYKQLAYRDRWTIDGSIKEDGGWFFINASRYSRWRSYHITMDTRTERTAGFVYHWDTDYRVTAQLILINNIGTSAYSKTLSTQSQDSQALPHTIFRVLLDVAGGVWVYFYAQSFSDSHFVDDTGYYLAYFDATLNTRFKYFFAEDFIGDMDVDYLSGDLWYTYPGSETILKIDNEGNTLYTITNENTDFLGGLAVLSDRTVWYSNDGDLVHMSTTGTEIDVITGMLDELETYNKLAADPATTEAIWAIWGFNVYRIIVAGTNRGTVDMSFNIEGALYIFPTKNGCWVWVADISGANFNHMQYISKENRRIDLDRKVNDAWTTSSSEPSASVFAPFEIDWQDENYIEKMPVDIDNTWKDLEYTEVPVENFIFSEDDKYYQARVKFLRQPASDRYGLPPDTPYVTSDDFNQDDGPPEKTQLWGRWSSNSDVYVEDNKLVMASETTCWIDTYKRVLGSGNFDVRWYFSIGNTNPVVTNQTVYLYIYAVGPDQVGNWVRATLDVYTDGTGRIYGTTSGGSGTGTQDTSVNALNTGLRIYTSGGNVYYRFLNSSGDWYSSLAHNNVAANYGSYFYVRLQRASQANDIKTSSFSILGGNAYFYSGAPQLKGIYTQESLKLSELHPDQPKNIYVKAQVNLSQDVSYQEEAQLRVKWRQPVP
jgi:hypothetical protein